MKLPDDITLPFFAYGLFKPGQLCFFRIRDLVENFQYAEVNGSLKERDGIPLLVLNDYSVVKGSLIHFQADKEIEAYEKINEIEPGSVYQWYRIKLRNGTLANVLLGKKANTGSGDLDHTDEWDGKNDPFFKDAIGIIEEILRENSFFSWHDMKNILRLQMAYTLLWSAIERYSGLRYDLGNRPGRKVNNIVNEEAFITGLKRHVKNKREVFSSSNQRKFILDPDKPMECIDYYYQVRSNSVHRGKAVVRDFDILKNSLEELLAIFKDMLQVV